MGANPRPPPPPPPWHLAALVTASAAASMSNISTSQHLLGVHARQTHGTSSYLTLQIILKAGPILHPRALLSASEHWQGTACVQGQGEGVWDPWEGRPRSQLEG